MTVRRKFSVTCAVCGTDSMQTILASGGQSGGWDLDFRPMGMLRQAAVWWVQICPHCGYTARNLLRPTAVSREWLQQEEFLHCSGISFSSRFAELFYRVYLICRADHDPRGALFGILNAAWECDDDHDAEHAILCRKLALAEIEQVMALEPENERLKVQRADLLRRTGAFDRLLKEYRSVELQDPVLQKMLEFELDKAERKETRRYSQYHIRSSL